MKLTKIEKYNLAGCGLTVLGILLAYIFVAYLTNIRTANICAGMVIIFSLLVIGWRMFNLR